MDQLNQVAQNMVKILSDWKDETDKYKTSIDRFQSGMDVQYAVLQNFINSNLATQSSAATKSVEKALGKRPLPQSSNETTVQSKRMKNNDAEPVASPSGSGMVSNTNSIVAPLQRVPKPFVMISPMAIKKEKDEMLIVVNSRTRGNLTVAANTGELRKNPSGGTVAMSLNARITRRNSKGPEQSLAIVMAKKSMQAKAKAQSVADETQSSQASNKENESFAQGTPLTSTPNVVSTAKKTVAKATTALKGKQVARKAMKPSPAQNTGRILTRRASKM